MNPSDSDKRPEAEFSATRAELHSILQTTPDYVLRLAPDMTIQFMNRTYPGVTIDKVVGTSILDWIQPEHRAGYQAMLTQALQTGLPQQLETVGTGEGDVPTWYLSRVTALREQGQVKGLIMVGQNISVRKQAEEALLRERDLVGRLMETSPVGLVSVNRDGEIVYANSRAEEVLGLVGSSAVGRTYNAPAWHITDLDGNPLPDGDLPFSQVKVTGKSVYGIRHAIEYPDGRRVLLSINAAPRFTAAGECDGMVAALDDVTERTRTEQELRRARERVRESTDVLMEGCQILGFDWRFLYLNDAAARQGRKPKEEFLGKPILEVLPGIEETAMFAMLRRVMEGRVAEHMVNEFTYYDGLAGWFELSVQPVDEGIFILSMDITERKRAEQERQRQHEQLLRTQTLESLATLARGIAHDFNNLLGGFFGNVSLARECIDTREPETAVHFLDESLKALARARGLTEQLITFAKGGEPVLAPTELGKFVRETARFSLSGSKLRCEVAEAPDLWPCLIDQTQIGQVIDNLAVNARQAMPEGGELRVDVRNVELGLGEAGPLTAGRYLRVTFADNGPGIAAENLSRVFDPFFSTKQGNSGLGLATSHSIVRRHGGHITVESEPGHGATFRVLLPAATEAPAGTTAETARAAPLAGRRVLIMDDEPGVRDVMEAVLRRSGADVTAAPGGDATVAAFAAARDEKRPYDVVILDLTIPGEPGGREVIVRLRAIDPDVRAIATSGYSDDPVMARPADFGFAGSLRKPHARKELEAALGIALARER